MNKKFKVLALAMSMAFVAPSVAMASNLGVEDRIRKLDKEISQLEAQYEELGQVKQNMKNSSKSLVDETNKKYSKKKSIDEKLFETSMKLDDYVLNTTPSLEVPTLTGYVMRGAEGKGISIRAKNADDLYKYVKGYFVMVNGKDKVTYDNLLRTYVDAIVDSVVVNEYEEASAVLTKGSDKIKDQIDRAKAKRKLLVKDKKLVGDLEKAVSKAKITLAACKQLISLSPDKIADVREELDSLMAEQEKLIKAGEKLLKKYE